MTNWTEADIGDQTRRTVLVTGANSGIGFEAARALAQKGATVVLGCRNPVRAQDACARITDTEPAGSAEVLEIDLADLESVERASREFLDTYDRLDLLVNNAGLMWTPHQQTAQGFEMQFGVNHLGHFALTGHLLERMLESGPGRVVTVSSMGHRPGRINFDDLNSESRYSPWYAYFQSKLANLLFTLDLSRRLSVADAPVIAVAAHPGGASTNLGHENPGGILGTSLYRMRPVLDRLFTQSAQMGALPTLRAATDPDATGGDYYGPGGFAEQRGYPKKVARSARAKDETTARRLWEVSEELTDVTYPI